MQRFEQVLQTLYKKLDVPLPEKADIIVEIAADLDSLYHEYREQGLDDDSAQKEAISKVVADREALEHFHQIKTPAVRLLVEQLPSGIRRVIEPLVILIATSAIASMVLISFLTFPYLPSRIFFWLTFATGLSVFSIGMFILYRLFIAKYHDIAAIRFLLRVLVWLGFLAGLLGLDGFLLDMWRFSELYARTYDPPFVEYFNRFGIIGLMHLETGFSISFLAVILWLIGTGRLAWLEYHDAVIHNIIEQS